MTAYTTRSVQRWMSGFYSLLRAAAAIGLAAPLLTGCQAAGPRAALERPIPTDSNAELVEYISDMPYVTSEAACRAAYVLATEEAFAGEYAELTADMKGRKLLSGGWSREADEFVNNGDAAALIARACDIRIGLNWRLTGLGRYAQRELIYLGIAHYSGEYGYVSGGEFVGMLARATEYVAERDARERLELGEAPAAAP